MSGSGPRVKVPPAGSRSNPPTPFRQERRAILLHASPPPAERVRHGSWSLTSIAGLADTRAEIIRLCVRVPPTALPAGAPVLAAAKERLVLAFTELAGNALRHVGPPVTVRLASTAQAWLLEVVDSGPDRPPRLVERAAHQPGGRGIQLVLALSEVSGWTAQDGVKTVWTEVPDLPTDRLMSSLGFSPVE